MTLRSVSLIIALGLVFFLITATTFASLGVILPSMVAEFGWSWTTGGLGFTALALTTGIFSPIAASSLKILGARRHYLIGGAVMAAGYALLGAANGAPAYLAATSLMGTGFALLANVPGTFLVGAASPQRRRNVFIGLYLAAGGAGGVIGPFMANALIGSGRDWRVYWHGDAIVVGVIAVLIAFLVRKDESARSRANAATKAPQTELTAPNWTARSAIKTRAFAIIALALTVAYFCGVTVSTWSVTHLQKAGVSSGAAVTMLSLYSAVNAVSRVAGGLMSRQFGAKSLLTVALFGNVIGMCALAFAHSLPLAIVFAVFDGFAFGMALFATTALIIDYFGLKNSPALLGAVNLAATVAMIGPTIAGATADHWGGFAGVFILYAALALLAAFAASTLKPPTLEK